MAVTSNKLIPVLGLAGLTIVGTVMFKQCSSDSGQRAGAPMDSVPSPDLPKATGADSDTPEETLKTVVTSNAELRQQVEEVIRQNRQLMSDNQRLRGGAEPAAPLPNEPDLPPLGLDNSAEGEDGVFHEPSALDNALDTAGRAADAVLGGLPSGGMERLKPSKPRSPAAAQDTPAPVHGEVRYSLKPPMGYAVEMAEVGGRGGVPLTRFVRTTLPSAPGGAAGPGAATQAARAAQQKRKTEDVPYFTIPENATLVGATAMTSLIGRVPINGRVTDPMQFKAMVGRDNLAANGFELPADIAGMIVTGIAIGDMALSCTEGRIHSMTFVFNDGAIRTVSERRANRGSVNTGNSASTRANDLGFISDLHGNPCIHGQFVTNAPAYLTDIIGLKALGLAGQAYAQAQTMTRSNSDGSITSSVTGNVGNYAMGQAVSGATDEVTQWMLQRLNSSFDAVITPSGQPLVIHLDKEIKLDKAAQPRKLVHRQQASAQISRGARYGLE